MSATPSKLPLSKDELLKQKIWASQVDWREYFVSSDIRVLIGQALTAIEQEQRIAELEIALHNNQVGSNELGKQLAKAEATLNLTIEGAGNHMVRAERAEDRLEKAERERDAAVRNAARLCAWLDSNTTFYNVDTDWPVEAHNVPVLALVSDRIWYHATDNITSYPFSAVIDAALAEKEKA